MGKVTTGAFNMEQAISQQEVIKEWKRKIEQEEYPFINTMIFTKNKLAKESL
ncbi:hypothetical protein [Paenibacillus sp. Z6-24]